MKPTKQKKITIALDAYPDVKDMLEKAKEETKRTQTSIIIEAAREWNERHRGHAVKHNGSKEVAVKMELAAQKAFSEAELEAAKKLAPELEKPIKRKKKRQ